MAAGSRSSSLRPGCGPETSASPSLWPSGGVCGHFLNLVWLRPCEQLLSGVLLRAMDSGTPGHPTEQCPQHRAACAQVRKGCWEVIWTMCGRGCANTESGGAAQAGGSPAGAAHVCRRVTRRVPRGQRRARAPLRRGRGARCLQADGLLSSAGVARLARALASRPRPARVTSVPPTASCLRGVRSDTPPAAAHSPLANLRDGADGAGVLGLQRSLSLQLFGDPSLNAYQVQLAVKLAGS